MNIYSGTRLPNGRTFVSVNGRPLDARPDLRNDSATTFDWGYDGHGAPAQLALTVLAHHFGDDSKARRSYEHFLQCVIRGLPNANWVLTAAEIDRVFSDGPEKQVADRTLPVPTLLVSARERGGRPSWSSP
jgi:hypothetical protein